MLDLSNIYKITKYLDDLFAKNYGQNEVVYEIR